MKQESSEAVVEAAKTCCRLRSLKSGSVCGIRFAKRPIIAAICICVPSRLETSRQTSTNTKRVNVRQKALFRMSCWLRRPQKGDGSSRLSRIAVKTHTHTHKHKHKHTHARVQAMLAERPGRGKRRQGWQGLPGEPPGPDLESSSERYPETGAVRSFWGRAFGTCIGDACAEVESGDKPGSGAARLGTAKHLSIAGGLSLMLRKPLAQMAATCVCRHVITCLKSATLEPNLDETPVICRSYLPFVTF